MAGRTKIDAAYVEELAKALHEGWYAAHEEAGWEYAPEQDTVNKKHPHLVAFDKKDEDSRDQNKLQARFLIARIRERGLPLEDLHLAMVIHETWALAEWAWHVDWHFHARHSWSDHQGPFAQEHLQQAKLVRLVLDRAPWREKH